MGIVDKKLKEITLRHEEYIESLTPGSDEYVKAITTQKDLQKMLDDGKKITWEQVKIIIAAATAIGGGAFTLWKFLTAVRQNELIMRFEEEGKITSTCGKSMASKIVNFIFKD